MGRVLVMRSLSRSAANDPSQPAASRVYSRHLRQGLGPRSKSPRPRQSMTL